MAEAPPPPQPGSLTESEGGKEGRHLVQWLRASLSTERGVRKAAQRSVASLESRLAVLERQLQGQKRNKSPPARSRLQRTSDGEAQQEGKEARPPVEELSNSLNEGDGRGSSAGPKAPSNFEGLSLESAAWRAWQSFSGEMARLAEEREAKQATMERKVEALAQQVESLLPKAPPSQSPECDSWATTDVGWRAASVAPDYHDVPGRSTSSLGRGVDPNAPAHTEKQGVQVTVQTASERGNEEGEVSQSAGVEGERSVVKEERDKQGGASPSMDANVGSLAIWGDFPGVPGVDGRLKGELTEPLPASASFGLGRQGRPTHMRTSSEGDASPWGSLVSAENDAQQINDNRDTNLSGLSEAGGNTLGEESGRVPESELRDAALYSPLEDDSVWDSILFGVPQTTAASFAGSAEVQNQEVEQALASMRGQLDRRMLGPVETGAASTSYSGLGASNEMGMRTRPSQVPYVTLPNTPLHKAAGLQRQLSQLSRSDSGASSDFR